MGWTKREVEGDLVILGDADGHVKSAGGLLVDIKPDPVYTNNRRYYLVKENGDEICIPGSASINRQLSPNDVGHFVKMEFIGWMPSANGKFKAIAVHVWDGEPSERMAKWPKYAEMQKKSKRNGGQSTKPADDVDDMPIEPEDDDPDALPF